MKLQAKIITLYSVVTIIVILAHGTIFYSEIWNERFNSVKEDISNQLLHIDFTLNTFFTEVKNDIDFLASNAAVRSGDDAAFTNFLSADEKTFKYNIPDSEQKIIDILYNYQRTHIYVNSVYMGRENGSFVRSFKRERPTRYDPRERPWYILAKNNQHKVMMTDAYAAVTTSDINLGIVKALLDEKGVFYGVVGADVTLVKLTNYIEHYKTDPAGRIILIDNNGIVLAGLNNEFLFKSLDNYSHELQKIHSDRNQQAFAVKINEEKNYVFFTTAAEYQWKIAIMIPSGNIEQQLARPVLLSISGQSIGLILLSIITFIGLKMYIVQPLKKFIVETNYIADTSNLKRCIDIHSRDEIGELAHSFNKMIRTLGFTYTALDNTRLDLLEHKNHLEDIVRKRTAELQDINAKLSVEVNERAATLKELVIAKEHAEESDKLKTAFLATMSHELRTPLNSIIGFTGIMLQGLVGPLNDEQKKQLQMVKTSAQHLLSLINDILDISKIEAGHLELVDENYSLRQTIEKTVESARSLALKKGLDLIYSVSPEIENARGDRRRVEQILLNLISNAVKFSENGSVKIICELEKNMVNISVSDTGIGIKSENLESLFKPFRQIDSGITRKYEGTGLGLSICKRLVEHMGGIIQVTSTLGKGSTFTVILPVKRKNI